MLSSWTCPSCGYRMSFRGETEQIKCPQCGTSRVSYLHSPVSESIPPGAGGSVSLSDLEFSKVERPVPEPAPPKENTTREDLLSPDKNTDLVEDNKTPAASHPVSSSPRPPSRPSWTEPSSCASSPRRLLETFGPTVMVCVLFLFWVFFDRLGRPMEKPIAKNVESIVIQAVQTQSKGYHAEALRLIQEALKLDPDSRFLMQLRQIFEQSWSESRSIQER